MKGSSALISVPKPAPGEMQRERLIDRIAVDSRRIVYVHAGAGYGKTTLLAQVARSATCAVWLTLTGESDILTFVDALCEAVHHTFPEYGFRPTEYLPFMDRTNFPAILANALVGSMEHLAPQMVLVLDDLHTTADEDVKELVSCLLRFSPENMRLLLGSREVPWPELVPLKVRGNILEITQEELAFTELEASKVLGVVDEGIYRITEGWPLAVGSFRVLLENGASYRDIPTQGSDVLSSYLFYECISRLPSETAEFLTSASCFDDLDAAMLDAVLGRKHSALILDSLTARNLFTVKTAEGHYRCHALFRNCLSVMEPEKADELKHQAALYYIEQKDYTAAARYAIEIADHELLGHIILASYRKLMRTGSYSDLRRWFQAMGEDISLSAELLAAKGAFLSCIGNFTGAQKALDRAAPMLDKADRPLYYEAMLHKARVLRNFVSFDASEELLDRLVQELRQCESETAYLIIAEKLYNLCWTSRIEEAYALARRGIEWCAREGLLTIRAWLERDITAVHFFAGNMTETVSSYEKSLALPEEDKADPAMHGVGVYAAKAYQMLGDRERAFTVLDDALKHMKRLGQYEEMWTGYLFAAEIHFQNAFIDRANGLNASFETTKKYFALADEYAPLYRKTTYQQRWAELQRLTYSVMFESGEKDAIISEIFMQLDDCSDYFKSIVLARLMGYFAALHDYKNAAFCASQCVDVGERTGMRLHSTLAYGILARCCKAEQKWPDLEKYTARYLRSCVENGILEYFRVLDYGPLLQYAYDSGIETECAIKLMSFAGYKVKKAYVQTFGGFAVFPFGMRNAPIKIRTRKERELFAFLLDASEQGATKEQIYEAIWSESESQNIKGLIGVNLTQLKKDLAPLAIDNLISCKDKRYRVCRDEIICDFELYNRIAATLENTKSCSDAQEILSLYAGEYLSDFEAFWAIPKRIMYHSIYEKALEICQS
jgi:LuxR family maltose regulon positive regulatory protein